MIALAPRTEAGARAWRAASGGVWRQGPVTIGAGMGGGVTRLTVTGLDVSEALARCAASHSPDGDGPGVLTVLLEEIERGRLEAEARTLTGLSGASGHSEGDS
jgi:hypothetical protein